jgi:hypothetical protein
MKTYSTWGEGLERAAPVDDLGLVQPDDRLGQRVDAPIVVNSPLRPFVVWVAAGRPSQGSMKTGLQRRLHARSTAPTQD